MNRAVGRPHPVQNTHSRPGLLAERLLALMLVAGVVGCTQMDVSRSEDSAPAGSSPYQGTAEEVPAPDASLGEAWADAASGQGSDDRRSNGASPPDRGERGSSRRPSTTPVVAERPATEPGADVGAGESPGGSTATDVGPEGPDASPTTEDTDATAPRSGGDVAASCGDGVCEAAEDCQSCVSDCGFCPPDCGDGSCTPGEDCATCEDDCGPCPLDCNPTYPGWCKPFAVNLPAGTNATVIQWWGVEGELVPATLVSSGGGTVESPWGACAATIEYPGRWDSWLAKTFPVGAPQGTATLCTLGGATVPLCTLPSGEAAWGAAHDGACAGTSAGVDQPLPLQDAGDLIVGGGFDEGGDDPNWWPGWFSWKLPNLDAASISCSYDASEGNPAPSARCDMGSQLWTDWHVMFGQADLYIEGGRTYVAQWCLLGSHQKQVVRVVLQQTNGGDHLGLDRTVSLAPGEWLCESQTFLAPKDEANAKLVFWLGHAGEGSVHVDEVHLFD